MCLAYNLAQLEKYGIFLLQLEKYGTCFCVSPHMCPTCHHILHPWSERVRRVAGHGTVSWSGIPQAPVAWEDRLLLAGRIPSQVRIAPSACAVGETRRSRALVRSMDVALGPLRLVVVGAAVGEPLARSMAIVFGPLRLVIAVGDSPLTRRGSWPTREKIYRVSGG